eukprot:20577-Pelagococcus_subviridis.AAC.1
MRRAQRVRRRRVRRLQLSHLRLSRALEVRELSPQRGDRLLRGVRVRARFFERERVLLFERGDGGGALVFHRRRRRRSRRFVRLRQRLLLFLVRARRFRERGGVRGLDLGDGRRALGLELFEFGRVRSLERGACRLESFDFDVARRRRRRERGF